MHFMDCNLSEYNPEIKTAHDVAVVAQGLLQGLAYLHSEGIIHRDLKTNNVTIRRSDKHVKIVDLGSAYGMPYRTKGFTNGVKTQQL